MTSYWFYCEDLDTAEYLAILVKQTAENLLATYCMTSDLRSMERILKGE